MWILGYSGLANKPVNVIVACARAVLYPLSRVRMFTELMTHCNNAQMSGMHDASDARLGQVDERS